MATKQVYVDDIDGSEATGPVQFMYEGVYYTLDLSDVNKAKFDKAIQKFIDNAVQFEPLPATPARRSTSTRKRSTRKPGAKSADAPASETDLIREWAKDNWEGELSARGRLPKELKAAYHAAHGTAA